MSMIVTLFGVKDDVLRGLVAAPASINELLDRYEDENGDENEDDRAMPVADLDKAWHGLHFLFTGTAWGGEPPLNFLVAGGTQIGEEDVGYGPARAYTSDEVRAIRDAVFALSIDSLRARFQPSVMMAAEVYPQIWDRDPEDDDTLGYLLDTRGVLGDFLDAAVRDGLGMLVVLS